jgi:predicted AAA+ superfamily ATPase
MSGLLETLLEEFRDKMKNFTGGIAREICFPQVENKIMVAIGMRRTGKTYLLLQVIQDLLKTIPITRILYINFEDDRLLPMSQEGFRELVDGFYTLYPENHDQKCYLFFDEIQNVDGWHTLIRRYFDAKNVKIYLTGSSAKLLSKEIHTTLGGRSFPIEVWPFSFNEYLSAQNVKISDELLGKSTIDKLKGYLNLYLKHGGFPESVLLELHIMPENWEEIARKFEASLEDMSEYVERNELNVGIKGQIKDKNLFRNFTVHLRDMSKLFEEERKDIVVTVGDRDRIRILQDYVSTVIQRDIVERYNITNISLIRYLIKSLMRNVGCSFTVHKFYKDIKSQGFAASKDTLYNYLDYISDAYFAFTISLYDESLRKMQTNPKKVYAIDTGMVRAYTIGNSQNIGHNFENLVYLDLRRKGCKEPSYYLTKNGKEVDFIARDELGQWYLYQVCWDMNDKETLERETLALKEAEDELGIKGEIITPDTYFTSFLPRLRA